jgi:molybdopterin converting factor small subunit
MKVTIKLFATLQAYLADGSKGTNILNLPEGATVQQVLQQLKIPIEIPKIILINGVQKRIDDILAEGDILSVFPPIAGG